MKHLEDEDIGRLIDGNINPEERNTFLQHLSECETCLKIYSETLSFIEDEEESGCQTYEDPESESNIKNGPINTTSMSPNNSNNPNHPDISITNPPTQKRTFLAIAASIILLIGFGIPLIIKWLSPTPLSSAQIAQMQYIENTVTQIDNSDIHAFITTGDKTFATIRTAIFIEDISCIINIRIQDQSESNGLQSGLIKSLNDQLKIIFEDNPPLVNERELKSPNNAKAILSQIRNLFKSPEQYQLLRFGQYIETQILSTYLWNETSTNRHIENINDYKRIAEVNTLPEGVIKNLNKLKPNQSPTEIRKTLAKIKEIFLPAVSGDGDIHETQIPQ